MKNPGPIWAPGAIEMPARISIVLYVKKGSGASRRRAGRDRDAGEDLDRLVREEGQRRERQTRGARQRPRPAAEAELGDRPGALAAHERRDDRTGPPGVLLIRLRRVDEAQEVGTEIGQHGILIGTRGPTHERLGT